MIGIAETVGGATPNLPPCLSHGCSRALDAVILLVGSPFKQCLIKLSAIFREEILVFIDIRWIS